ncbi:hypothetical protein EYF80_045124 [Liparis tanakae]|uniref:Uncharacterized protein n=1 Tax=Liparis tanakae TaxID=230148 RepID=A0A4Z2FV16_9TELE|nr:hypothetical protein EYF80_045124 [Liparis tanakae]
MVTSPLSFGLAAMFPPQSGRRGRDSLLPVLTPPHAVVPLCPTRGRHWLKGLRAAGESKPSLSGTKVRSVEELRAPLQPDERPSDEVTPLLGFIGGGVSSRPEDAV